MNTSKFCRDQQRRRRVRAKERNGLDYLEVNKGQLRLTLFFLGQAPTDLTPANIRIDGGVRIRNIKVISVYPCLQEDPELDDRLQVTLDKWGDFSTYRLRLVEPDANGRPGQERLAGFDPRYSHLDFNFKVECPSDFDCQSLPACPPPQRDEPEISYLAKDYASFRQLILDRMALVMPEWTERHVPDLGVTLVEVLAYVGDHLSYYQDAVATEAYLDTARRRISVRRHARLVDYSVNEGLNARAWVCIETEDEDAAMELKDVYFITAHNNALRLDGSVLSVDDLRNVPPTQYEVFEPIIVDPPSTTSKGCNNEAQEQPPARSSAIKLYEAHNRIRFYTWGDHECCLPLGATTATLRDKWVDEQPAKPETYRQNTQHESPAESIDDYKTEGAEDSRRKRALRLAAGDVLIFEEVKGPRTGADADADPSHRHAVRLVRVELFVDDLLDPPRPIVEIEWAAEDALPFPLCISAVGEAPKCADIEDISVARGNVLLADHGRTVETESWVVPADEEHDAGCEGAGEPVETILRAASFRPRLSLTPLTHRAPFPLPAAIAREQARLLEEVGARVMARVNTLWRRTRSGQVLVETEIAELLQIFGEKPLARVGLVAPRSKDRGQPPYTEADTAAEQAAAIGDLLSDAARLLAKKSRRVSVLAARAQAGYVLGTAAQEIGELFGEQFAGGLEPASSHALGPASLALEQDAREALAVIGITEQQSDQVAADPRDPRWLPRNDLLSSQAGDRHFVAEIDNEGRGWLRFGDGELGRAPEAGTKLTATYRTGNGRAGNVGAEAISHLVFRKMSGLSAQRVRNPLPARGGSDPESLAEIKLFAPSDFRKQLQRAITADDYARLAERNPRVQRAAASLHWTGSWYEVRVAIDPFESAAGSAGLLKEIESDLYRYRRVGHDLSVQWARYVPLD
ncbi:MAG: putative baseplate assembly protein, partial [Blastocatellia bacterium]